MARETETSDYVAFMRRTIKGLGKRAAYDVEALAYFPELVELLNATMAEAARECHGFGYSWTEVADALGVSRQAARQRFAGELES